MRQYATRDEWLAAATEGLRADFEAARSPIPEKIRSSFGFPHGGGGGKRKTIGQHWDAKQIGDGIGQIYISPTLDDPIEILATLVHELVHAAVGSECGHKGEFKRSAQAIGLVGKMTATTAGETLTARLSALADDLGPLPHSKLTPNSRKKQGTRMLKAECVPCEYIVRLTRKMIDQHGCPICPACLDQMIESV